jgi:hypothetical protein
MRSAASPAVLVVVWLPGALCFTAVVAERAEITG